MSATSRRSRRAGRRDVCWGVRDLRSRDTNQLLTKFSRCAGHQLGLRCVFDGMNGSGVKYETGRWPEATSPFHLQHCVYAVHFNPLQIYETTKC